MQILSPGAIIDQYEIASRPMMGGMGVVYFCIDHGNNDRPVALKTFKPEFLPDRAARDRFLREGGVWVALGEHAHIVRCYAVKYIDPTAFLVLELIAKEQGMVDASLRSWITPGQPMRLGQALLFAIQVARGMRHAVKKVPGFVHRDLKPENLLVGADKLPGTQINRLRVTDFGLVAMLKDDSERGASGARRIEKRGTEGVGRTNLTQGIVGTPLYMAPEQWQGQAVGVFTDVYALGCILYEMLTGQGAAEGREISELQAAHCGGNLRRLPNSLPADVAALLNKCLALAPSERYNDWNVLTTALESVYTGHSRQSAPQAAAGEALSRAEREQAGWSYNAMGVAYLDMGKAEVAVRYHERARAIGQEAAASQLQGAALCNLGIAYCPGRCAAAIGFFEQALAIAREIGDRRGQGAALCNLGIGVFGLWETPIRGLNITRKH